MYDHPFCEQLNIEKLLCFCSRSCGKIFCADCSDQTITIPSEQFFTPVRVCGSCFQRLASHSSENVPGPNGSSILNGLTGSTIEEPGSPHHQNCSNSRNIQYANQNGCDLYKSGCSTSSNIVGQPSTTTVVPSKDLNHSSKFYSQNATAAVCQNGSSVAESCSGAEEIPNSTSQCYTNHANLPRNLSSKPLPASPIFTPTHATTKGD